MRRNVYYLLPIIGIALLWLLLGTVAGLSSPHLSAPSNVLQQAQNYCDAKFVTYSNPLSDLNLGSKKLIASSLVLSTANVHPTCDVSLRGNIYVTQGALGVADSVEVCVKTALDLYVWKAVSLV